MKSDKKGQTSSMVTYLAIGAVIIALAIVIIFIMKNYTEVGRTAWQKITDTGFV